MKQNMQSTSSSNIAWVDALRIAACFMVVLSHSCDHFVANFNADYSRFLQGCGIGSAVRSCVPLFVMMSGVLLFPVKQSMSAFYTKRISRLAIPLVFWSLALPLMYWAYFQLVGTTTSPAVDMTMFTDSMTWRKMLTFVFNFNYDTTALWYLYMLLGLYFVMPILSVWMQHSTQKDLRLFLMLWGISLVLPYVKMFAPMLGYMGNYGHMGLLGECDWNAYGTFYYVSGFVGYLVLAHYLVKYPLQWSWRKMALICIPMFLVGYAITYGGFVLTNEVYPGNYAYLEIIWLFNGINVFMMTFPVFILFQKIPFRSSATLSRVASMTFGIYLCHFVFVLVGFDFYTSVLPQSVPAVFHILINALTVFLVSYIIVRLISASKIGRRLVG